MKYVMKLIVFVVYKRLCYDFILWMNSYMYLKVMIKNIFIDYFCKIYVCVFFKLFE